MNKHSPTESDLYAQLGVSSSKAGVQAALGLERSAFFCPLQADCCGDPLYLSALHADGAGTKSIVAYLAFRETGEPRWFRSLAQDSLIMHIDDLACVNALENLTVCNTIGRNRRLIPDTAIQEIIAGYRETAAALTEDGIPVRLSGGETADIGDLVRTLVVDSAVLGRVKKNEVISTDNIMPGDIIVGDANGVVVIPPEMAEEIVSGAEKKLAYEAKRAEEITRGVYMKPDIDEKLRSMGVL